MVELPTDCEACVLFARELEAHLLDKKLFKLSALEKELEFVEALENVCPGMLKYKLHKEKNGIERFAKEESSTMKALYELRERGVKVDLGMPYEMWGKPSVEVLSLRTNCELLVEKFESHIEKWFNSVEKQPLQLYICEQRALIGKDKSCLRRHSEL